MREIGALILAAGGSTRLGEPKQFLLLQGETLVRRIAKAARDAGCMRIVVVAGDFGTRLREELEGLPADVVENRRWRDGIGTSIAAGVTHLRREVSAIVVLACDQPFVSADHIRKLRSDDSPIVASGYAGTVGIPALFDSRYFDALVWLPHDAGAKALIEKHTADVALVPFPEGAIDIDTAADYEALSHGSP